jgi:hypothetical protein
MTVHIRIRRVVTAVWILKSATWRWVVVNWPTSSRRRAISTTVIIVVATAGGASITIATTSLTARAISSGGSTTFIIIRVRSSTGRSRATLITGNIRLGLGKFSSHEMLKMDETYICDTSYTNALELTPIKFFYCSLEICSSFEFNKAPRPISTIDLAVLKNMLTLCRLCHGQSRSTQRQGWIDARSLLDPKSRIPCKSLSRYVDVRSSSLGKKPPKVASTKVLWAEHLCPTAGDLPA